MFLPKVMVMSRFCVVAVFCAMMSGCAHTRLRNGTVAHSSAVGDIHTQVVLDNLAKFAANPNALPHFTYPTSGTLSFNDSHSPNIPLNFNPFGLVSWTLGNSGTRSSNLGHNVMALNDPLKLDLMRCAYQRAVLGNCRCIESGCGDCRKRLNRFYLGSESPGQVPKTSQNGEAIYAVFDNSLSGEYREFVQQRDEFGKTVFAHATGETINETRAAELRKANLLRQLFVQDSVEAFANRFGRATATCIHSGWFVKCDRKSRSKFRNCELVGNYCDTSVAVPEKHRAKLTELTLVILDIALNDPTDAPDAPAVPEPKTKEVTAYVNAKGELASSEDDTAFIVKEVVDRSTKISDLFKPSTDSEGNQTTPGTRFEKFLDGLDAQPSSTGRMPFGIEPSPSVTPRKSRVQSQFNPLSVQQNLNFLSPQQ